MYFTDETRDDGWERMYVPMSQKFVHLLLDLKFLEYVFKMFIFKMTHLLKVASGVLFKWQSSASCSEDHESFITDTYVYIYIYLVIICFSELLCGLYWVSC